MMFEAVGKQVDNAAQTHCAKVFLFFVVEASLSFAKRGSGEKKFSRPHHMTREILEKFFAGRQKNAFLDTPHGDAFYELGRRPGGGRRGC